MTNQAEEGGVVLFKSISCSSVIIHIYKYTYIMVYYKL